MAERDWKQTACIVYYVNCGVEVVTEGRDIVRVRGEKAHPGTGGYLCQKAQRLSFYGNHRDRLTSPLRRRPECGFEEISWDTALTEISERLLAARRDYGGDAFAFVGGGGQGNHLGGASAGPTTPTRSSGPRRGARPIPTGPCPSIPTTSPRWVRTRAVGWRSRPGPGGWSPYHRNIAVRLVPVVGPEAEEAEQLSRRVLALANAD